jgi:hypothetical protein
VGFFSIDFEAFAVVTTGSRHGILLSDCTQLGLEQSKSLAPMPRLLLLPLQSYPQARSTKKTHLLY